MTAPPVADALVQLSHLVQRVFADVSRDHGLTPQQAQLLCRLEDGPVGMGELSRMLNLEKSSLTGLVDRVQRRGLVNRVRDGRDGRTCTIELTADGEALAVETHRDVTSRLEQLTGRLPRTDRTRLAATVGSLLADEGADS